MIVPSTVNVNCPPLKALEGESLSSHSSCVSSSLCNTNEATCHWSLHYRAAAYGDAMLFGCTVCQHGFPSFDMYTAQSQVPHLSRHRTARTNNHAITMKNSRLLCSVSPSWISQRYYDEAFPSYSTLLAIHMLSIYGQQDHIICVFRQSSAIKRTEHDTVVYGRSAGFGRFFARQDRSARQQIA